MKGILLAKKTGIILFLVFIVALGTGCAIDQQIREDREAAEAAMKAAQAAAERVEAAADRVEAAADRAEAAAARADRAAEKCERIFQKGLRK
jgi:sensor c-di-GMP phosphodiesterase-like protein